MRGGLALKKRKKKPGEHSSPETAGVQNLSDSYIKRVENTGGGIMKDLLEIRNIGFKNREDYGGKWDAESLEYEIGKFFEFCAEKDIKPAKAGIRSWLGLSRSQYHEWETNTSSHPLKSDILGDAHNLIEMQYLGRGEKHPTFNMFLLKAGHGYSDKQELEIHSKDVSKEEIGDIVNKMGLNE